MSVTQLFGVLRAARWSIVAMMLVASLTAFLYARTLPKQYTAKARVLLDIGNTDPTQFTGLKKDAINSYLSTALRLVGDAGVAGRVVDELGWVDSPQVIDAWQQQTGGTVDLRSWAASRVTGNLGASQLEDSAVIEIFYSAADPQIAKQIVGFVRTAYIANSQQLRVTAASRAAAWNRRQAARAKADLERAEQERIDFAKANKLVLNEQGLTSEMSTLDASIRAATQRGAVLPDLRQKPTQAMVKLQQDLNNTELAVATLAQQGPANPDYLAGLSRAQSLRAQLARATAEAKDLTGDVLVATQEMRAAADRDYLNARLLVLQQSDVYDHLLDLERAIAMKRRLYDAAVARADQFDLIAASPSTIKIVGDVIGSDDPSFPDIPVMTALGAGFGMMLGVALALIGEMMGHRIRTSEDLAVSSTVPVLAVIESGSTVQHIARRWRWPLRLRRGTLQPGGMQPAE